MATQPSPGRYILDPAHSTVGFRHKTFWGLATVKGSFGSVEGNGTIRDDGGAAGSFALDAASLDTKNAKRDKHLRSEDFFHAESFPKVDFQATRITPVDEGSARVEGELSIRGTSTKLDFPVRFEALGDDAVVLRGSVEVDRARYGMTWNQFGMIGGPATIDLDLRFIATR